MIYFTSDTHLADPRTEDRPKTFSGMKEHDVILIAKLERGRSSG